MREVEVLIVGGGASGLTASMLLSTYGVSTHLVNKYPETSKLPKAHLLSIKTMEIYREVGAEAAIRAISCPDENMRYVGWYAGMAGTQPDAGRRIARFGAWGRGLQDHDWAGASDNSYTNLTQSRLEPLLKARAEELAPGAVHFNHNFISFIEDSHGVVAELEDRTTEERYQVRARYLLACDGGRSVNPQLGIEMEGKSAMATTISVHFSADLSPWARDPDVLIRTILSPELGHPCVLVPMGPGKWGPESKEWVFHLLSFPGDHKRYDDATAVEEMKKALGLPDLQPEIHMVSRWPLDQVVASRFRVGRAFIVGDAAHRMPPAGGHGLNTAVQDCYNLCWKITAALRGQAGTALLDTYEEERRPVAQRTVASAFQNWQNGKFVAAGFGFSPANTPAQNWHNLRLLWGTGPESNEARRRAGEGLARNAHTYNHLDINFGYVYGAGAFVPESGAPATVEESDYVPSTLPGHTLPHAWVEDLQGRHAVGEFVGRGRFTLIAGDEAAAWSESAQAIASRRRISLDVVTIGLNAGDWFDQRREWGRRSGVGTQGAVLVRPDRFVAWRSVGAASDPASVLESVFDTVMGAAIVSNAVGNPTSEAPRATAVADESYNSPLPAKLTARADA